MGFLRAALAEQSQAMAEALASCAAPSPGGLRYLREVAERTRLLGRAIEALCAATDEEADHVRRRDAGGT